MKYLQKLSKKVKIKYLFITASLFFILAALFGMLTGSVRFNIYDLVLGEGRQIFYYIRLPRTIGCLICGAALAVSGCITQSVLNNRLASPSVIGVNAGAGLSITICTALGIYGFMTSVFAFAGAFLTVLLVTSVGRRFDNSRGTLILLGVGVNSFLNAISSAIVTVIPDVGVMSNNFRVGDFSGVTFSEILIASIIIVIALGITFTFSTVVDVISLGDENARSLGLNTKLATLLLLLVAALLAGCAVSICGLLSFVGLIVPHMVRMMGVTRSGHLLPLSALFGAGFVALCDTLSRIVFSPYELPVGIIMAFIGAPFFVLLLFGRRRA